MRRDAPKARARHRAADAAQEQLVPAVLAHYAPLLGLPGHTLADASLDTLLDAEPSTAVVPGVTGRALPSDEAAEAQRLALQMHELIARALEGLLEL